MWVHLFGTLNSCNCWTPRLAMAIPLNPAKECYPKLDSGYHFTTGEQMRCQPSQIHPTGTVVTFFCMFNKD